MKVRVPKLAWDFIDKQEGDVLHAYWDVSGWAISRGIHAPDVSQNTVWTQEQSDMRFGLKLHEVAEAICPAIIPELDDGALSACISISYNITPGEFLTSTLLRKLNSGDVQGASDEFPKWCHVTKPDGTKEVNDNLLKRRNQEKTLFLSGSPAVPEVRPAAPETPPVVVPPLPVRVDVGVKGGKVNPLTKIKTAKPITKVAISLVTILIALLQDPTVQATIAGFVSKHALLASVFALIASIAALIHEPQPPA